MLLLSQVLTNLRKITLGKQPEFVENVLERILWDEKGENLVLTRLSVW